MIDALPMHLRSRCTSRTSTAPPRAGAQSQWWSLQDRQARFCKDVLRRCLDEFTDVAWLLQNLDDDELLHCGAAGDVRALMRTVPADKRAAFVSTVEAVYPDGEADEQRCFRTDTFVRCDHRKLCSSYYGGKSFGLVSETWSPFGPHEFQGRGWKGEGAPQCHRFALEDAAILRPESCIQAVSASSRTSRSKTAASCPTGFTFTTRPSRRPRRATKPSTTTVR